MNDEQYTWEDLLDWETDQIDVEEIKHIDWDALDKDEYCRTLIEYYQHEQDDYNTYDWRTLFNKYNNLIDYCSDKSKQIYNGLEDEVTIYRGADKAEELNGKYGISWTLNPKVALFFAYDRYKNKDINERTVIQRKINKEQIKAIITEMDEDEVIVTDI